MILDMGAYDPFDPNASQTKKGWLTAILELGAWFGTLFSGFLAETFSRKYGIIVACCIFIIGVVVQACAIQAGSSAILGGRFVTYVFSPSCEIKSISVWFILILVTVVWVLAACL